jgi:hypothetical protein
MGRQQMQPIPCNVEDITTTITNTALEAPGQREGRCGVTKWRQVDMGTATFLKTMLQKGGCPHFDSIARDGVSGAATPLIVSET